ncbi:S8 family serine peptidase [Paenibacillus ferrarius]|uniref:S8 family serine peptidase n=1 Tax=Paenibacillus ferrarius TaxID=1469647 RepID=UPI003D2D3CD2
MSCQNKMSTWLLLTLLFFILIQNLLVVPDVSAAEEGSRYLVSLKHKTTSDDWVEKKGFKTKAVKKLRAANALIVKLDSKEYKKLQADTDVEWIEKDSTVVTSTYQTSSIPDSELVPWGVSVIGSVYAQNNKITGQGIKIAVLDTGISTSHSDLHLSGGESFVEGVNSFDDDNGHGTHVAGTINAIPNNTGIVGIAPNAEIYSLKVLDSNGSGYYSSVVQAIDWCISNQINIISMSFGGTEDSQILHDMIQKASAQGILIVAAAGNQGAGSETEMYPARYPEVISVGSVGKTNQLSTFSSTGNELDLVAPGEEITSTTKDGNYGVQSGTSMAAPHVTGAAALLWSSNRQLSSEQVKDKLLETATPLGDMHEYGHGLVNVTKALGLAEEIVENPANPKIIKNKDEYANYLLTSFRKLQKRAIDQQDTALAKEIQSQYNEFQVLYNGLRDVPSKVTEAVYGVSQASVEQEYMETNKEVFTQLLTKYQQSLTSYSAIMESKVSSSGVNQASLGIQVCCTTGDGQTIFAGGSATVSVAREIPLLQMYVYVRNSSEMIVYEDTSLLYDPNLTSFTWQTSSSTEAGTYTIEFYFPQAPSENITFVVYVVAPLDAIPITLDSPIDVNQTGSDQLFSFTPTETQTYRLFTGGYAGTTLGDTALELYSDPLLNNMIASSYDPMVTEILTELYYGQTYYIRLFNPYGGDIIARMVVSLPIVPTVISSNVPIDVDVPMKSYQLFSFTPSKTSAYKINTTYFGGSGSMDDTMLYLYSDPNLSQEIAFNDDSNGTLFSQLNLNLLGNTTYYIKLAGYGGGSVHARLSLLQLTNTFTSLSPNASIDLTMPSYTAGFISFTPASSGIYKLFTGKYGGYGGTNDTMIYLYSDSTLNSQLGVNDDANGTVFSELQYNMTAGTTYYIVLRGWSSTSFNARFTISGPTIIHSVQSWLDYPTYNGTISGIFRVQGWALDTEGVSKVEIWIDGILFGQAIYGDSREDVYSAYPSFNNHYGGYHLDMNSMLLTNGNHTMTVKETSLLGNLTQLTTRSFAVQNLDIQPPTVPSTLRTTSKTATSVGLSWLASTDNVGVIQYKVYNGSLLVGSTASTAFVVQGLTSNTLYALTVKAMDAAGNESQGSNIVYVYSGSYQYQYDTRGRIDYILLSSGQKLKHVYDANGNLLSVYIQ